MSTFLAPISSVDDYKFRTARYIQRCKFKFKQLECNDLYLSLDYMGAAEYEFGSVPDSRERMRKAIKSRFTISSKDYTLQVLFTLPDFVRSDDQTQAHADFISSLVESVISGSADLKRHSGFKSSLSGPFIQRLKKGCKKKMETVPNSSYYEAWWDIQNDWIMWFSQPNFNVYIEKLFSSPVKTSPSLFQRLKAWFK